jgi:choline dehydrogenase
MVYCRGLPSDYDDWRDAGNPGWGWSDIEPVYRGFERRIAASGTVEGDGPLWIADREPEYHPLKRHFYAACCELGLPRTDLNGENPVGIGPYAINTRAGLRWSSSDAFLRPAMRRHNVAVRPNVFVEQIVFTGRKATGAACRVAKERRVFDCRGEIIICAGAVNSPKLLQLSGIGPPDLLAAHGVPVVHANGAVGGRLQDHLGINYFYRATEPTLNAALGTWPGRIIAALQFALLRRGPFSLSVNQAGGLVRSSPTKPWPDVQLYFNPLSYSTEHAGKRPLLKPDPFPGFIIGFNACRPTSTGRIDFASVDPAVAPRIVPNYLSTDHDLIDVLAGARLIGRLQETAAMRGLIDGAPAFDPARASDAEIIEDFRARSETVFHPCGTCRMAPQAAGGVVGSDLRVHGVEGLRVVDASIFPNITSANINAPTILVAHMAARAIVGR